MKFTQEYDARVRIIFYARDVAPGRADFTIGDVIADDGVVYWYANCPRVGKVEVRDPQRRFRTGDVLSGTIEHVRGNFIHVRIEE